MKGRCRSTCLAFVAVPLVGVGAYLFGVSRDEAENLGEARRIFAAAGVLVGGPSGCKLGVMRQSMSRSEVSCFREKERASVATAIFGGPWWDHRFAYIAGIQSGGPRSPKPSQFDCSASALRVARALPERASEPVTVVPPELQLASPPNDVWVFRYKFNRSDKSYATIQVYARNAAVYRVIVHRSKPASWR